MKLEQIAALIALLLLPCATSRATITIDTVPVGNIGNANDPASGNHYGGVNYAYSIGKYEVTVGQYTAFLNAVAATDTYSLYSSNMAADSRIAGISRTGASGSYSYNVIGSANHPIAYVSWGDAARFANWLSNGQPSGAQGAGTTETGPYTLNGATSNTDLMAVTRNTGAAWIIPTENEWYKAAYHQPVGQGGDSDNYWAYPMKTNSVPYSDQPPGATPDNTRVANYYNDDATANGYNDGFAVTGSTSYGFQTLLTNVGAYTLSPSFYGTFDQGGNVWEWNETAVFSSSRGALGGSWTDYSTGLSASNRDSNSATWESSEVGFRVASASVPEPGTILLAGLVVAPLAAYRRRRS